jgi:hypothetical protein
VIGLATLFPLSQLLRLGEPDGRRGASDDRCSGRIFLEIRAIYRDSTRGKTDSTAELFVQIS